MHYDGATQPPNPLTLLDFLERSWGDACENYVATGCTGVPGLGGSPTGLPKPP